MNESEIIMDFWPEFIASSWGREFVAGGFGGIAGIISGYPLDTLRIRLQQSNSGSAFSILRRVMSSEGPAALYRGMGAPLASVTFQNAMVFQTYAILSRALDSSASANDPPSYKGVALGGVGTGAIQSIILSPVELIKIRLQLQNRSHANLQEAASPKGPLGVAKSILKTEGLKGMYRGKNGQESVRTMLTAGGLAGVASWLCCYPLDVVKTRLQAQSPSSQLKYKGILDCFSRSVKEDGYCVLWRGLGTAVARAFVVNGAVFASYETALRCLFNNGNIQTENTI
ncbi:hypothetical protein H0E87_007253 [Populus deltoides]|uniref:Mitochondrial substrate carrier family protein n=1 Tax=Populus deltoides TaxID=3696 RepID=A0A8T2ZAH1_POPDE|nr:hypothetical protein H0E87_007253 [Populus deltoides]